LRNTWIWYDGTSLRFCSPLLDTENLENERAKAGEHELHEHRVAIRALSLADKGIGRDGLPLHSVRAITAPYNEGTTSYPEEVEEEKVRVSGDHLDATGVSLSIPVIEEEDGSSARNTAVSGEAAAHVGHGGSGNIQTRHIVATDVATHKAEYIPTTPLVPDATAKDMDIDGIAEEPQLIDENSAQPEIQERKGRKEHMEREHLLAEIKRTQTEIEALDLAIDAEEKLLDADENSTANSFVTFRTRHAAAVASQCLMEKSISVWRTHLAPAPTDIVWKNARYRSRERGLINLKINLLGAVMVIFFFLPVNGVKWLVQHSQSWFGNTFGEFGRTLYSILIALVLTIFIVLGHIVSRMLSRQSGHVAYSKMDKTGAWIYFWLIVVNILLVNIIGNEAVWVELREWIEDPGSIAERLSRNMAVSGTAFMQIWSTTLKS